MKKLAIGIDKGGTRTKIGLVDLDRGKVSETLLTPTEKYESNKFLHIISSKIDQLRLYASIKKETLLGVGIGVPGFVFEDGIVDTTYGFLEFMEDYPLAKYIENLCALPCRVDNDASVVALGEALFGKGDCWC